MATPRFASVFAGSLSSMTEIGSPFRNTVRSGRITLPDGPVTVVNVEWNGGEPVEIFYKDVSGAPGSQLLYRFNEARM